MLCKSDLILISCKPSTLSFDIVRTLNLLTWKLKNEELTQYDDSAKALLWALIKIKLEIYPRIYMNLSIKWRPAPEKLRYKERKKNLSSWQKKHRIMLWPFWPHNSQWSSWNSSGEQWLHQNQNYWGSWCFLPHRYCPHAMSSSLTWASVSEKYHDFCVNLFHHYFSNLNHFQFA